MSGTVLGNIKATESKFTWQIPNFSHVKARKNEYICSPTFVTFGYCQSLSKILNLHWRMNLYPSGDRHEDYFAVYLENLDVVSDAIDVSTFGSIALIDDLIHNKVVKSVSFTKLCIYTENQARWGWSNFERKESILKQCSTVDTLTFSCHIHSTSVKCNDLESDEEYRSEALTNHFEILFNTGQFSDMTISVENQKLYVHKSIVTSLSPVFRAMFENQMKEQIDNSVEIVDVKFDVMKEMLRYIYVGKVNGIEKIDSDLFIAADKYLVNGLKSLCEKSLCKNLTVLNALQRLEIAVQYNTKRLKPKVIQLIIKHLKYFNKSEKKFKEISSECKTELLSNIANNHSESMFISCDTHSISCDDSKSDEENCPAGLLEHFDMLFNTGKLSDMKIKVGDQELPIHTNIVTFFSPVLREMIESRIENNSENKILEITDVEFDTMKEMLRYMYARKVDGIEKIVGSLFMAADRYGVKQLKRLCEKSLCNNLDVHNALERLEISVQSDMKKVNSVVSQFIVQNFKVFIDKPEFHKLSSAGKSELLSVIAEAMGNDEKSSES